jgi:hypothetical protein
MKRKIIAVFALVCVFLTACSESAPESPGNENTNTVPASEAHTSPVTDKSPEVTEPPVEDISLPRADVELTITDFQSDFPTLFMQMKYLDQTTGEFLWHEWVDDNWVEKSTSEPPDIYFVEDIRNEDSYVDGGYFDKGGNRIESAPWLGRDNEYAGSFSMWDFDGNGIPTIIIWFRPNPNNASCYPGYWRAFRLVDDEYRSIMVECDRFSQLPQFSYSWRVSRGNANYYTDGSSGLVVRVPASELGGGGYYARIEFNGNKAIFTTLATLGEIDLDARDENYAVTHATWDNLLTGAASVCYSDPFLPHPQAHLLPGSDIMLTPLEPMTDLQKIISGRLTQ